jgi:hypothetical protein
MKPLASVSLLVVGLLVASCGGSGGSSGGGGTPPPPVDPVQYAVLAWGELGMHCIDGKDYSVFAVLPPYNTIHAQVVSKGSSSALVSSGVTVTYEAVADATGSINTGSATKTNFWTYVQTLLHANVAPDVGITGVGVQSSTPKPMTYDATLGNWKAEGIPTIPYDDSGASNAYPMAKIVVRNAQNTVVATTTVVLAVSDEMSCRTCHASGSNPAAQPAAGWENATDPAKDVKWNILRLHDEKQSVAAMVPALQAAGYAYQSSLYATAKAGTPILCAACHASNALGTAGIAPATQLTTAMHSLHGSVMNLATGLTLDNATTSAGSCYLCHPGANTKCQRGAMHGVECFDCHGNLSAVGASTRTGWLDVPACQMCHNGGQRYPTTFSSPGVWRTTSDSQFATSPNVPVQGKSLYRYSTGHGGMYCSTCHGSQHAEYPTTQPNDNVAPVALQGYTARLTECGVCHSTVPTTSNGGPHGLHTVGQAWVQAHQSYARSSLAQCGTCHGTTYRGTILSMTVTARSFNVEGGTRSFAAGMSIGCYDCHNGPNGG